MHTRFVFACSFVTLAACTPIDFKTGDEASEQPSSHNTTADQSRCSDISERMHMRHKNVRDEYAKKLKRPKPEEN